MPRRSTQRISIPRLKPIRNFSRVAEMAEKKGRGVIFKNNRPKLLVIDLDTESQIKMTEDEKLEFVAARILREHRAAFEELAK